ncbi:MAG: sigma 54-interacting transcriptional regulator [Youngiibacter sp.]|nr:sigma 54-interacting transcriptional regulator [Youngiibacter sp.]
MGLSKEKIESIMKHAVNSMPLSIVTDENANIVFISRSYKELLELTSDDYVGKPILEIIPNSKIPYVLKTGKEMIGDVFVLKNGELAFCNRILIRDDKGNVLGALSNFTFGMEQIEEMSKTIERLKNENLVYKSKIKRLRKEIYSIESIASNSTSMKKLKTVVAKIADSPVSVLITGETGTGKEVFANAIHMLSNRYENKFVKINCAAIPKDLLESELFGYEDGAFSGAVKGGKIGKFELANGGTILLDEIGEMSLELQSKLLRVLQEREIERVGGLKTIKIDVRVISSTNQDIEELVRTGKFREDLYYRINVVDLMVPPLRERYEDIPALCDIFIEKINRTHGLGISGIDVSALKLFRNYNWPGNIRELEHVIERASVMKTIGILEVDDFEFLMKKIFKNGENPIATESHKTLDDVKDVAERELIIKALLTSKGNKTKAAETLGINRSVLYDKMKKHGIE